MRPRLRRLEAAQTLPMARTSQSAAGEDFAGVVAPEEHSLAGAAVAVAAAAVAVVARAGSRALARADSARARLWGRELAEAYSLRYCPAGAMTAILAACG